MISQKVWLSYNGITAILFYFHLSSKHIGHFLSKNITAFSSTKSSTLACKARQGELPVSRKPGTMLVAV
jgi:hypothetical protein